MTTISDSTIKDFAKAVRSELNDLPKSVIEELTSELETSLEERRLDEGDSFNPGSPITYAAELRDAAGVPPKSNTAKNFSSKQFIAGLEQWFRRTPVTEAILEFGISIRPLWWITRAFLAWGILSDFYPNSVASVALLMLLIFLSVQWGRKKWFTNKFFRASLLPLNLVAIIALLPGSVLLSNTLNSIQNTEQMMQQWSANDGLEYNGSAVTKLRAIDSNGIEVTGLSFENQDGTPIEIGVPLSELSQYQVPDIAGLSLFDAQRLLDEANVPAVDYVYLNNVNEQEAYVLSVDPPANSTVTSRDVVTITLDRK